MVETEEEEEPVIDNTFGKAGYSTLELVIRSMLS